MLEVTEEWVEELVEELAETARRMELYLGRSVSLTEADAFEGFLIHEFGASAADVFDLTEALTRWQADK